MSFMKKRVVLILFLTFFTVNYGIEFFKGKKMMTKIQAVSVATDSKENVYVIDKISNSVLKYSKKGWYKYSFGVVSVYENKVKRPSPVDIFIHRDKIYLLDMNNGILIFNKDGEYVKRIDYNVGNELLGEYDKPQALYVDDDGIYITDTENHRVQMMNHEGETKRDFGFNGKKRGAMHYPSGISRLNGYFIVADTGNSRVEVFDKHGLLEKNLGNEILNTDEAGSFKGPVDIFTDKRGLIYVVDEGNERIQVFDADFDLYMIFGKKGYGKGKFAKIRDVWVSNSGNIYIADTLNRSVHVYNKDIKLIRTIGKRNLIVTILGGTIVLTLLLISLLIYLRHKRERKEKKEKLRKIKEKKAEAEKIQKLKAEKIKKIKAKRERMRQEALEKDEKKEDE